MANMKDSIFGLNILDSLSCEDSAIHRIHPVSNFMVTMTLIVVTLSFDKYEINGMLPLIVYPITIIELSSIPKGMLLRRILIGMLFVIGVGIFNPLFDRGARIVIFGVVVSGGWMSFLSSIIRGGLAISAAILMISTMGMNKLTSVMYWFRVPKIFVLQIVLTFRYISVLINEFSRSFDAYILRSQGQKGIMFNAWGTFLGQILMRTFDRSEKIYNAMKLRGFNGKLNLGPMKKMELKDMAYALVWFFYFIVVRFVNLPTMIGTIVMGG